MWMLLAVFPRPSSGFRIPGEGWLRGIVVKVLPLHHLAKHDDQAVERTAGRPPRSLHTHATIQVIDVWMPDGREPLHARPALRILIMEVDLHLVMVAKFGIA